MDEVLTLDEIHEELDDLFLLRNGIQNGVIRTMMVTEIKSTSRSGNATTALGEQQ